ncbi:hypothetical protein BDV98DRAFT_288972 [Pterulicium gracile]|uniref:Uncharacterized protein n=1 Tax=Pterulicium gracile TaxID=1884261 RepID=A0A5C3QWS0_9AGAR|nr:hypothetical protein BDV98DRAFT_288972 [Pterula gracilis]
MDTAEATPNISEICLKIKSLSRPLSKVLLRNECANISSLMSKFSLPFLSKQWSLQAWRAIALHSPAFWLCIPFNFLKHLLEMVARIGGTSVCSTEYNSASSVQVDSLSDSHQ